MPKAIQKLASQLIPTCYELDNGLVLEGTIFENI